MYQVKSRSWGWEVEREIQNHTGVYWQGSHIKGFNEASASKSGKPPEFSLWRQYILSINTHEKHFLRRWAYLCELCAPVGGKRWCCKGAVFPFEIAPIVQALQKHRAGRWQISSGPVGDSVLITSCTFSHLSLSEFPIWVGSGRGQRRMEEFIKSRE